MLHRKLQSPYQGHGQCQEDQVRDDVRNGLTLEELLKVQAVARDWLPIPEVMDRRALEYYEELTRHPPRERDGANCIQCSSEPHLRRHLGRMLGEDARVEEEDGEFDHGDRRSVDVLKCVEDDVPFLHRVRASHCLVLPEVEMDRYPSLISDSVHRPSFF